MTLELTGYKGSQGLASLNQADKATAHRVLRDLRDKLQTPDEQDNLRTKSGVVRLLHTTKNKDLKFKTAGAFKRIFLDGAKLKKSGEVIAQLLENAGLPEDDVNRFKQYVKERGNRGVETKKVLRYIDMLQAESGDSKDGALKNFGVTFQSGGESKQGGMGQVQQVKYRGQDYVYKSPRDDKVNIGVLKLADELGNEFEPAPVQPDKSFVTAVVEEDSAKPVIMEEQPVQALPVAPPMIEDPKQKLGRTGLGGVARVKDLPQVITPTVYVIHEARQNGTSAYHAVAGQKTLKDWAKTQEKGSSYQVVGLLMPKAKGDTPIAYEPNGLPKGKISQSDLKPMAGSALTMLKGLADHGFIHGDIKPDNMYWDADSKNLQLIDTDGLVKVSKHASSMPKGLGVMSPSWLHPSAVSPKFRAERGDPISAVGNAQLGFGRDVYAMGLVLLETSLLAEGYGADKTKDLMVKLTHRDVKDYEEFFYKLATRSINDRITILKSLGDLKSGTVSDFARQCVIKALEFEDERIKADNFGFGRENGPEAKLLEELEELFTQVQ